MNKTIPAARFNKKTSLFICLAAYSAAIFAAIVTVYLMNIDNLLITALCADCIATIIVFAFSMGFNNSSMYDPYWSAAPIPIVLYWAIHSAAGLTALHIVVIVLVALWGTRLTYNWLRQWKGLAHEDWRYIDFRKKAGSFYWVVSFFGIHFFPTVMVFLGCLSLYPFMNAENVNIGVPGFIALVITGGAILIEAIADNQLRNFIKSNPPGSTILSSGLWGYSRHPNYFGEVTFWWGLFIFSIAADTFHWWTIAGPIAITVMFLTVSIPMMEKRMLGRRPQYAERQRIVSALIPWFPKKNDIMKV